MRVITGSARGRKLKEPKDDSIRPTTDRVKEAIFSIIQFELEGRRVLDLFGGTGQMGIEALSRGAAHCTFVDLRKDACQLIRDNLEISGFENSSKVVQSDYQGFLNSTKDRYDVVILDPPYETEMIKKSLQTITTIDKLAENGIIVCENRSNSVWPATEAPYVLQKEYRYGKISVALYRRVAGSRVEAD